MFCKKCGKEVKDGATFCGHCGAPMNQSGGQQGTLPPLNAGAGTIGSGSLAGNSGENSTGNLMGKNKLFVIGAAAAAMVLVIGLGIALFSGKSNGIVGTWKWECGYGELISSLGAANDFDAEFFAEEMEDMGIKMSDFPNVQGTLEFDKDGKWRFGVDEERFVKVSLEAGEMLMDAMVEEGYMDEDEAEDALKELKEEVEEAEDLEEELSVFEWSGTYEADPKKGEIELTIKRANGEKNSGEVLLDYEIDGKKLSLEVQEDEYNYMNWWKKLGLFDEELTR